MNIQKRMKSLGPLGELDQVALEGFSHGIEEAPHGAGREGFMPGLTPFSEHARDILVRANADIRGADDQVMRRAIIQISQLVGADAGILVMPRLDQLTNCPLDELWQIPVNKPSMFPGNLHLAAEAEVVTNEDTGSRNNASREGLVVAIAQAENPAVVGIGLFPLHLEEAKISAPVMRQGVSLIADVEPVHFEGAFDLGDEVDMWDRGPGGRSARRGNVDDIVPLGQRGPAMKDEIWAWTWSGGTEECDHIFGFLSSG